MNTVRENMLIYRIRHKQDANAYGELYDIYVEPVYRFIFFKISNKEEAEDATSEVFIKAWHYVRSPEKDVDSFRRLVYTIARNHVIDIYRKRAKEQTQTIEGSPDLEARTNLAAELDAKIETESLLKAMTKLKQDYQDVLHLRYIEGMSVKEIAKIMDKPYGNVRVLLHRAVKKIKDLSA